MKSVLVKCSIFFFFFFVVTCLLRDKNNTNYTIQRHTRAYSNIDHAKTNFTKIFNVIHLLCTTLSILKNHYLTN